MVSLDHVNLSVESLTKTLDWYEKVFDFKVAEQGLHKETPYAIVRNDQSMLCFYEIPGRANPEMSNHHKVYHFGLRVVDAVRWTQHLEQLNIEPHLVWDYPHSKSWYLQDPSGHEIEVCFWNDNQIQFSNSPQED